MLTPEVDPHRDAIDAPKVPGFTDAIDLLSAENLDRVSPGMHRGWEDRRFSCRRSRTTAQQAIGVTLTAREQEQLLLLSGLSQPPVSLPAPVRLLPGEVLASWECLERLVNRLLSSI